MKVTGAFLAESAAVLDGKLNVEGGFLRYYRADADRVATLTLVVLAESGGADDEPALLVGFTTPTGDSQTERVEMPAGSLAGAVAGETSFAFWPLWIPIETDGQYRLEVRGDGSEAADSVTLTLTVQGDDVTG